MNHVEFIISVLENLKKDGNLSFLSIIKEILKESPTKTFQPEIAVRIIDGIVPQYRCDITHSLPQNDLPELSRQIAEILSKIALIHKEKNPLYNYYDSLVIIIVRFINTLTIFHALGYLPDNIPNRESDFFLLPDSDCPNRKQPMDPETLRRRISNWDTSKE